MQHPSSILIAAIQPGEHPIQGVPDAHQWLHRAVRHVCRVCMSWVACTNINGGMSSLPWRLWLCSAGSVAGMRLETLPCQISLDSQSVKTLQISSAPF